jgi:hypothetical protein
MATEAKSTVNESSSIDNQKVQIKGSAKLDLDINANGEVLSLDEVLGKENVVGELYMMMFHTQLILNGLINSKKEVTTYFR